MKKNDKIKVNTCKLVSQLTGLMNNTKNNNITSSNFKNIKLSSQKNNVVESYFPKKTSISDINLGFLTKLFCK